jgi:hypothetical protein
MIRTICNDTNYTIRIRPISTLYELEPKRYYQYHMFLDFTPGEWAMIKPEHLRINDANIHVFVVHCTTKEGHEWEDVYLVTHDYKKNIDRLFLKK